MMSEMVFAGFGGQGVMLMGQILTYAGMLEKRQVSWMPSYGPEMRGGTANCSVIISDEPVGSPIISEPDVVVAMNLPSLDKFEPILKPGGVLLINSSLVTKDPTRTDVRVYRIPCNEIAAEIGNAKVSNMVMIGSIVAATQTVEPKSVVAVLQKIFKNKQAMMPLNEKAIQAGIDQIK